MVNHTQDILARLNEMLFSLRDTLEIMQTMGQFSPVWVKQRVEVCAIIEGVEQMIIEIRAWMN